MDASSRTLVTQTPNLPYISSFYKRPNNSLSHLYRESYDTRDLPSFTISAAEWDTFAAADREMSSDMGKIVNMLNNDSQSYYTPVDYLLDTSFHGFTTTSRYAIVFIKIFGLGTLLLTLAFAATNYIRTRRLSATLMTLTMSLPKTTANPIGHILRDNYLALSETNIYHTHCSSNIVCTLPRASPHSVWSANNGVLSSTIRHCVTRIDIYRIEHY